MAGRGGEGWQRGRHDSICGFLRWSLPSVGWQLSWGPVSDTLLSQVKPSHHRLTESSGGGTKMESFDEATARATMWPMARQSSGGIFELWQ
jgi:hypothetical protein